MKIYFYENEIGPIETDKIEGNLNELDFVDVKTGEKYSLEMNEIEKSF